MHARMVVSDAFMMPHLHNTHSKGRLFADWPGHPSCLFNQSSGRPALNGVGPHRDTPRSPQWQLAPVIQSVNWVEVQIH